MKIDRNEAIMEIGGSLLFTIGLIQGLFLLCIIASPFVYLWGTWEICWKVIVTGVGGMLICYAIYKITYDRIGRSVDEAVEEFNAKIKEAPTKSRWMSRVEDAMKEAEEKRKSKNEQ